MIDRFYLPGPWRNSTLEFPDEEFHHLVRVLRKQVEDIVEIFDGQGRRATAVITQINKKRAEVELQGPMIDSPRPARTIELAVAPPKGERFKWLVEKCTELGVDRMIPLRTLRSVVDPRESKLQKLDQTIISACKQCRRDRLMELLPAMDLTELCTRMSESMAIIGDLSGGKLLELMAVNSQNPRGLLIIIGPEGGFTPEEFSQLRDHGAQAIAIGEHILRIETAALALAAACRAGF